MNHRINGFLYIIALIPLLGLSGLYNVLGENIVDLWLALSLLVLILLIIGKIRIKFDHFLLSYLLYATYMIIRTLFNPVFSFGMMFSYVIQFLLLAYISCDYTNAVTSLAYFGAIVVIVNFLSVIGYGKLALYSDATFLLGGKNALSMVIIPILSVFLYIRYEKNNRLSLTDYIIVIMGIASIILSKSSTGTIVSIIFIALIFIAKTRFFNEKLFIIVVLGMNVFILFFYNIFIDNKYVIALMKMFGKDTTMAGRLSVWDSSISKISDNFILGVGRGITVVGNLTECHNGFLQELFNGGIIGIFLFLIFFVHIINNDKNKKVGQAILFVGLISLLINALTESVFLKYIFIIFMGVVYYSKEYNKNNNSYSMGK